MSQKRKPWLFRFYQGPDDALDFPWMATMSIGGRPDLMQHPRDEGRMVPVVAALTVHLGRWRNYVEDGRPWPEGFHFRVNWRSEAGEIATRLAGGPE